MLFEQNAHNMKNWLFFLVVPIALLGCNTTPSAEQLLQDEAMRKELFSTIAGNHEMMMEFMNVMIQNEHAMSMMQGNKQMMQHMMGGKGMQHMMGMMKENASMMQGMMQHMMNDPQMMRHMMQMMHQKGMMSQECMQQMMQQMGQGMDEMKSESE